MKIITYTNFNESELTEHADYNDMLFKSIITHVNDLITKNGYAMLSNLTSSFTKENVRDHMYGWTKSNLDDLHKSNWKIEDGKVVLEIFVKEISDMVKELK